MSYVSVPREHAFNGGHCRDDTHEYRREIVGIKGQEGKKGQKVNESDEPEGELSLHWDLMGKHNDRDSEQDDTETDEYRREIAGLWGQNGLKVNKVKKVNRVKKSGKSGEPKGKQLSLHWDLLDDEDLLRVSKQNDTDITEKLRSKYAKGIIPSYQKIREEPIFHEKTFGQWLRGDPADITHKTVYPNTNETGERRPTLHRSSKDRQLVPYDDDDEHEFKHDIAERLYAKTRGLMNKAGKQARNAKRTLRMGVNEQDEHDEQDEQDDCLCWECTLKDHDKMQKSERYGRDVGYGVNSRTSRAVPVY